jgi:uncharacterized membrane protein YtjA (UPF0391 family)
MLKAALIFALLSIVCGVLGFAFAIGAFKALFAVFMCVFLVFLSLGLFTVKALD